MMARMAVSLTITSALLAGLGAASCQPAPPTVLPPGGPTITVVNIIPNAFSGETNQDSEPNVAVNPEDTNDVVGSAFTPNPAGVGNAPIFFSRDGGDTWAMNFIVPTNALGSMTGDITVRFPRTGGVLYAGILRRPQTNPNLLRVNILSTTDFTSPTTMNVLVDRNGPDQPYVQATTVGGDDRVYVGNNDLALFPGATATVDFSTDDAQTFNQTVIEARTTQRQDQPPIRPAITADGQRVYVAFFGRRPGGNDVVVVRDDSGATGANPFTDLSGSDGLAGVRVVTGRTVPFENFPHTNFGQERLVASNLTIAVDPNDDDRVCVGWGDRTGTDVLTLHVRCSDDAGQSWSSNDLRTVNNATNPALAINGRGTLGFLYQQLDSSGTPDRWITRFEQTGDNFTTRQTFDLANVPANAPAPQFTPYIGDYVHLMAAGNGFYGIFSANNTPERSNFPSGVIYQREVDWNTGELRDNGGNPVAVSIDPFFFRVVEGV